MFAPHHRHYAAGFLLDCGVMVGFTALPFVVFNHLHGGPAMSGGIGAAQAVLYAVLCVLLSAGAFPWAARGLRGAALGATVFSFCFGASVLVRNPYVFGTMTAVGVGCMAFVWPAMHAWIGAEPNLRRRGRRMARFNMGWSLGFTVGPLIGGPLYELDYRLPFLVAFLMGMACVVILLLAPDEKRYFGVFNAEAREEHARHDRASEVHLLAAWVANMVANGLAQAVRNVYPKHVEDLVTTGRLRLFFEDAPARFLTYGAAEKFMWLAFFLSAANASAFFYLGRTHRWHHRWSVLAALQTASAVGFFLLGSTNSLFVMVLCCAAVGAAWGGCFFAAVFYSVADPARKHRRAAINEATVGIGGAIGSSGVGWLAGAAGMTVAFHVAPLAVFAALLLQLLLLRVGMRRDSAGAPVPDASPAER